MSNEHQTLTFDGVEHSISGLSDDAKAQLQSLQETELEMQRLNKQLAMITTARNAYHQALTAALPKADKTVKPAKKKKASASV